MLRSYLAAALRHLLGQRLYSAINLAGLAVGLACFVLIALFVEHELGYDRQWANAERIYRISRDFLRTDISTEAFLATNAPTVAPLLEEDFAEVEETARVACCGGVVGTAARARAGRSRRTRTLATVGAVAARAAAAKPIQSLRYE